jgi:hypothetical protein
LGYRTTKSEYSLQANARSVLVVLMKQFPLTRWLMKRHISPILLFAAMAFVGGTKSAHCITVLGHAGDGLVDVNGLALNLSDLTIRPGSGGDNSRGQAAVFIFPLPTVPSAASITSAKLRLTYLGIDGAMPDFNADLFGIDSRDAAVPQASDYFSGPAASGSGELLADNFLTTATPVMKLIHQSSALDAFVRDQYQLDGAPLHAFIAFRVNADVPIPTNSPPLRGYLLATADNLDARLWPELELTVVPEPSTAALSIAAAAVASLASIKRRRYPSATNG